MRKSPLKFGMLGALIAAAWVAAGITSLTGRVQAQGAQAPARAASATAGGLMAAAVPVLQAQAAAAPAQAQTQEPEPPVERAGRRDPFRPLVVRGAGDRPPVCTAPGKGGLIIGQVNVQGIVRGLNGQWIAVADNNTNRAYFLYVGDSLCNGTVSRISGDSVVFEERVTDQMGRTRTREVTKRLAAG